MGCAERAQARWAAAETHRETDVLDLQGRDIEEPVADEVYVCLVDAGHGEDRDSSGISRATEPFVGRSADGSTRVERATPPVAGLSAESWSRRTLAEGGLPAYLQRCQNLRSACVFRGRGGCPVGRAFRNDMGASWQNSRRLDDGGQIRDELDFRRKPNGATAFCCRGGACYGGSFRRILEAPDPRSPQARVPDRRWASHAQVGDGQEVRRIRRSPIAAVLPAALLPGTQSRRTGLERLEEPYSWSQGHHRAKADEANSFGQAALDAKDPDACRVVLSLSGNKVCGLSPYYYGKVSILIKGQLISRKRRSIVSRY